MNFTGNNLGGNAVSGIPVYGTPPQLAQSPMPQVDTVSNLVSLMLQQSEELKQRTGEVANQIAGPQPEPSLKDQSQQPTLISILRVISERLGSSLLEIERLQRAL